MEESKKEDCAAILPAAPAAPATAPVPAVATPAPPLLPLPRLPHLPLPLLHRHHLGFLEMACSSQHTHNIKIWISFSLE